MLKYIYIFLVLSFIFANSIHAQISNGLVSKFSFDNPLIFDDSLRAADQNCGYYGLLESTMDRNGNVSSALAFNGTSTQRGYAEGNIVDLSSDFTIAYWVYINDYTNAIAYTVSSRHNEFQVEKGGVDMNLQSSTHKLYCSIRNTGGAVLGGSLSSLDSVSTDTWHHVAVVRSGNDISLYLDGTLQDQKTLTSAIPQVSYWNFGNLVGNSRTLNGNLDDVLFYDKALSTTELNQLNNGTLVTDSLGAHFSFDNPNASILIYDDLGGATLGDFTGELACTDDKDMMPNRALEFSADSSQRAFYPSTTISLTTDFAISYWVYINAYTNDVAYTISSRHDGTQVERGGIDMNLQKSSHKLFCSVRNTNGSAFGSSLSTIDSVSTNTWHHVAVVRSGNEILFYLNGILQSQKTLTGTVSQVSYWNFGNLVGNARTLDGKLDEILFYNRSLSLNEVKTLAGLNTSVFSLVDNSLKFKLHPNPTSSYLNIDLDEKLATESMSIINMQGQIILEQELNSNKTQVNVEDLPSGVYFARIITGNRKIMTRKFVKK